MSSKIQDSQITLPYYYPNPNSVCAWVAPKIGRRRIYKYHLENTKQNQIKTTHEAARDFIALYNEVEQVLRTTLKGRIAPEHLMNKAGCYLAEKLDRLAQKYRVNSPEDTDFEAQFLNFKECIADNQTELFNLSMKDHRPFIKFLEVELFLRTKLESICEKVADEDIEEWKTWFDIAKTFGSILEISLAHIFRPSKVDRRSEKMSYTDIPVRDIEKAYSRSFKRFIQMMPIHFRNALDRLRAENKREHVVAFPRKRILSETERFLKIGVQLALTLDKKKIEEIGTLRPDFEFFVKEINTLFIADNANQGAAAFRNRTDDIDVLSAIRDHIQKNEYDPHRIYAIDSYFNKTVDGMLLRAGPTVFGEMTYEELCEMIQGLSTLQSISNYLQVYLLAPLKDLEWMIGSAQTWVDIQKKKKTLHATLQKLRAENGSQKSIQGEKSIDELLDFISPETPKKVNPKKKGKRKTTAVVQPPVMQEISPVVERQVSRLQKSLNRLSAAARLSRGSEKERIALKQAHLYLRDLAFLISKDSLPKECALLVHASIYYTLEQAMRLLVHRTMPDEKADRHNLKRYLRLLNLKGDVSLLEDYYLANFWTHSLYEQKGVYEENGWTPPPLLGRMAQVVEGKSDPHAHLSGMDKEQQRIEKFLERLKLPEGDSEDESVEEISFRLDSGIVPKLGKVIETFLQKKGGADSSVLKDKLQQVALNVKILEGLVDLSCASLPRSGVQFLVRQACFWQGRIMEGLLQALSYRDQGVPTFEHSFKALLGEVHWSKPLQDRQTMVELIEGINRFSRYPFDANGHVSVLHQLILRMEAGCEAQELEEIKGCLEVHLRHMSRWMETQLLPELERRF